MSSGDTVSRDAVVPKCYEESMYTRCRRRKGRAIGDGGRKKVDRLLCGPRVLAHYDPEQLPRKVIRSAITNVQLTGAHLVVSVFRAALGDTTIPDTVRLFRQLTGFGSLR